MHIIIKLIHVLLLMILVPTTHILGLVKFTLPKTDIVHTKSGLILHYLSEYRPANKIITFTVSLPMYADMCYLLPNSAMGKISECQNKEDTMQQIRKINNEVQKNNTLLYLNASKIINSKTKSLVTVIPTTKSWWMQQIQIQGHYNQIYE